MRFYLARIHAVDPFVAGLVQIAEIPMKFEKQIDGFEQGPNTEIYLHVVARGVSKGNMLAGVVDQRRSDTRA